MITLSTDFFLAICTNRMDARFGGWSIQPVTVTTPQATHRKRWSSVDFWYDLVAATPHMEEMEPTGMRTYLCAAVCAVCSGFTIHSADSWPDLDVQAEPEDRHPDYDDFDLVDLPDYLQIALAICINGNAVRRSIVGTPELAWTLLQLAKLISKRRIWSVCNTSDRVRNQVSAVVC